MPQGLPDLNSKYNTSTINYLLVVLFVLLHFDPKQNTEKWRNPTHNFLPCPQHSQLAEAHVERGGMVGPIFLLHDHNIDGPRQGGRVDLIVEALDARVHPTHKCKAHTWLCLLQTT